MHKRLLSPTNAHSLLLFFACAATICPVTAQQPGAKSAAQGETVPGFSVSITYSPKAMQTLVTRKETVIVAGYLYEFPKQGTPRQDVDGMGQVDLGETKDEIAPGVTAVFTSVRLNQPLLKWADNRGPQLLINVYSGRKSSPNNLIDCGIYEGPFKDVQGKAIPIACKLIGE